MVRVELYDMCNIADCSKCVYVEHLGNCYKQAGGRPRVYQEGGRSKVVSW
jgi:hypothetical protein